MEENAQAEQWLYKEDSTLCLLTKSSFKESSH